MVHHEVVRMLIPYGLVVGAVFLAGSVHFCYTVGLSFRRCIRALSECDVDMRVTFSGLLASFAVLLFVANTFPCTECWAWMDLRSAMPLVTLLQVWVVMSMAIREYAYREGSDARSADTRRMHAEVLMFSLHCASGVALAVILVSSVTNSDIWELTAKTDIFSARVVAILLLYSIYRGWFASINAMLCAITSENGVLRESTGLLVCSLLVPPVAAVLLACVRVYRTLFSGDRARDGTATRLFLANAFLQLLVSVFNPGIPAITPVCESHTTGDGEFVESKVILHGIGVRMCRSSDNSVESVTDVQILLGAFFVCVFLPLACDVVGGGIDQGDSGQSNAARNDWAMGHEGPRGGARGIYIARTP